MKMDQSNTEVTEPEKTQTSEATKPNEAEQVLAEVKNEIDGLTTALIDKAAELESLHDIALEQEKKHEAEMGTLKSRIEELEKALEIATKEKEAAVSELNGIKDAALLSERLTRLHEAKLLRSDDEAKTKQAEKVKAMSGQEFEEYFNELSDVRSQNESKDTATKASEEISAEEVVELIEKKVSLSNDEETKSKLLQIVASLMSKNEKPEEKVSKESDQETNENKESAACNTEIDVQKMAEGFSNIIKYYKGRK